MGNLNSYQTSDSGGSMENNENTNINSSTENDETLDEFKCDLSKKREQRVTKLNEIKSELNELRLENEVLKKRLLDVQNPDGESSFAISDEIHLKKLLSELQYELQIANSENLSLSDELDVTRKQVNSLKEVIEVSKKMIAIREEQVDQLKMKLKEIEESLNERELKIMSDDLRKEYNRQLENIKNLKSLYEERARVSGIERDNLQKELVATKSELNVEIERSKNLTTSLGETVASLTETKTKLDSITYDKKQLEIEMTAINELSSKILTGFKSETDVNLDRLSKVLEENRGLLIDMTNQNENSIVSSSDASILPKLLFDLVVQADRYDDHEKYINNNSGGGPMVIDTGGGLNLSKIQTTEEIMLNLPKVWRILIEFLSHQTSDFNQVECADDPPPNCNEVALSVSKTFIKLKDLILEKKSLQKETNRLKTLNGHLDKRLKSQEKRLSVVSLELTKTWHLVGRMQRQHRQLHTNEQILRYQLQQKRRMLNELKDELEYCRRKWAMAKEKNIESEDQWRILHNEFESRKRIGTTKITELTNSAESGYDDDIDETDTEKDEIGSKIVVTKKFNRSNSLTLQIGSNSLTNSLRRGNSEPLEFSLVVNNDNEDDDDGDDEDDEEMLLSNPNDESLEAMFVRLQSFHTVVVENHPSTSSYSPTNKSVLTEKEEEYTTRRAERLRRLEEQCQQLKIKFVNNLSRGQEMSSQLDTIHDRYNKTGGQVVEATTTTIINKAVPCGGSGTTSESSSITKIITENFDSSTISETSAPATTETIEENSENCDENDILL